ncbi:uroporphyrinogen decarboxylase [Prolixibacteraceae bacterium Z1-6]|uniref:Uroporphyrinogen decarboxylase n=1 Tax=Draconibacterium aestuarii TaxID=2998507 RepID=A0A9X3F3M1_9BACT|nr:uroporphyrinogen decarboxylase [Prolixibacteraceae bacterium Z1-6]
MEKGIFVRTLEGEKTERPPVWFMRQAGRVLPSYLEMRKDYSFKELMRDPELAAKVTLLPIYDLGVDAAILFSDILVIPEALGMDLAFTDSGPRFTTALKDLPNPVKSLNADASKLEYIYDAIDKIQETKPADIPLIGFCGAPFTTLCYMVQGLGTNHTFPDAVSLLYKDKKLAKQLLGAITDLSIEYALNQVKHGISAFQIFETHAGLIPSDLYMKLIMPFVRKISAAVMNAGVPTIFLPKGLGVGLTQLQPGDADIISIDWQVPIKEARKMVPKEMGLQGNLDPRILLADQNVIENKLEEYLSFGAEESNWIFNVGHGFIPGIPVENAKFVVDWIKKANWNR